MEDYSSIIDTKIREGNSLKQILEEYTTKFKKVVYQFSFSALVPNDKSRIGELMHYANLADKIVSKVRLGNMDN